MNKLLMAVVCAFLSINAFPSIVFSETPQTPQEAIKAELGGVPVMMRIAKAESDFNPRAKNASSTASGLFQILHSTFIDNGCVGYVFSPTDNVLCAARLYSKYGTDPWLSSSAYWQ